VKKLLSAALVSMAVFGLAGCNDESFSLPEHVPDAPESAKQVLGHHYDESTDYWADTNASSKSAARSTAQAKPKGTSEDPLVGILPKNIQNLLCNSVHHAKADRYDQAYHKLDMAKNDKLVKLADKGKISQEQYIELDNWMGELIDLLNEDIAAYPDVQLSFPFDCAGQDDDTEAVGEVIEIDVEDEEDEEENGGNEDPVEEEPDPVGPSDPDPVDEEEAEVAEPAFNADKFIKKVCFSTFAGESHDYLSAADYLVNADVLAHHIFHDPDTSEEYKSGLRSWLHKIHRVLILNTPNYTSDNMPFQCERYRARYKPSGFSSTVNDIANTVVGAVRDIFDDIGDFFDRLF